MFKSDTRLDATHVVPPPLSSGGDPRTNGATITVYNSAGLTDDVATVTLPPGTLWRTIGSTFNGYEYRDPNRAAAITRLQVKNDTIVIRGGDALWPYTLEEPPQGRVAVRVTSLRADVVRGAAAVSGTPPSTARNDKIDSCRPAAQRGARRVRLRLLGCRAATSCVPPIRAGLDLDLLPIRLAPLRAGLIGLLAEAASPRAACGVLRVRHGPVFARPLHRRPPASRRTSRSSSG